MLKNLKIFQKKKIIKKRKENKIKNQIKKQKN